MAWLSPKTHLIPLIILILVCGGLFANTLQNKLIWDDACLVFHNRYIKDVGNIPLFFTPQYWNRLHPFKARAQYRPLRTTTLALDYFFWQQNPLGVHLTNLLLHTLNVFLVYVVIGVFVRRFRAEGENLKSAAARLSGLPFLTALLFAAHPVHVEAVTFVMNRGELLACLFFLLSFFLFMNMFAAGKRCSGEALLVVALVCFFLAIIAKEMALSLPLVMVLYAWSFLPSRRRWQAVKKTSFFWGLALIFFCFRFFVLQVDKKHFLDFSFCQHLLIVLKTLGYYLYLLLFPFRLTLEHAFSVPTTLWEPAVFFSGVAIGSLVVLVVISHRRSRFLCFAIGWIILTLLPAANLVYLARPIAEQRLYLPSVGVCLLLSLGIKRLWLSCRSETFGKVLAISAFVAVLVFYSAQTILRNRDWGDEVLLHSRWVQTAPRSPRAHLGLGDVFLRRKNAEQALFHYRSALRLDPGCAETYNTLGIALAKKGDMDSAIAALQKSLRLDAKNATTFYNLGVVMAKAGRSLEAIQYLKSTLQLAPDRLEVHRQLGILLARQGFSAEAIPHYRKVVQLEPKDADTHYNLGLALAREGRLADAGQHFRRALQLNPRDALSCYHLGNMLMQQGHREQALDCYQRAAALDSELADTLDDLPGVPDSVAAEIPALCR